MLVIPGVEITKDYLDAGRSAHLLLIDLQEFVPASWDYERIFAAAREQDALVVACHPHHMSARTDRDTLHLWNNRERFAPHIDAWEIANRDDVFGVVGLKQYPYVASSDFHRARHLYSWKTLRRAGGRPARSRAACGRTAAWPSRCSGAEGAKGGLHMELPLMTAAVVVVLGVAGLVLQGIALRAAVRPRPAAPVADEAWPPVSILKPLAGLDDNLFANLESFCRLDYPRYEVICCLRSANDPAHAVAAKVRARHPGVDFRILVSTEGDGHNPKVRNMLPGGHPRRPGTRCVLVSDSNVKVVAGTICETVRPPWSPGVGLVTNLIRGRGGRSVGSLSRTCT